MHTVGGEISSYKDYISIVIPLFIYVLLIVAFTNVIPTDATEHKMQTVKTSMHNNCYS